MNPLGNLGATYLGQDRTLFRVWAPLRKSVEVHVLSPAEHWRPLQPTQRGYFEEILEGVSPGCLYQFRLDGLLERPDPTSRFQPHGVHGPSQVIDPSFPWHDSAWAGLPLHDHVLYELHVGTFTEAGTFEAVISHLDGLRDLGITALELMPVAQFPGNRNWGYDGTCLFAAQNSYGGPRGLQQLVDACHRHGLAVVLDVVYNHVGPEGNYLADFGPYFTDQYRTPWGPGLNLDGRHSDEVRRFLLENALAWQTDFHLDGLRLDAVHAMKDFSARPFLAELAEATAARARQLGRPFYLLAESNLNDPRLLRPPELGGHGLDGQWSDDFHHALHCLLTRERTGYYHDFRGVEPLAQALRDGFAFTGQFSAYRGRRHGSSARDRPAWQHIVCLQNHDQVGNRMRGDRLSQLVSFEQLKLGAAAVLLSPFLPLLFMGEEYGETAPFPFFTSHGDAGLIEAVRGGRKREFAAFAWAGEPPDPQAEQTFLSARLNHHLAKGGHHRVLQEWHRELLRLRNATPALAHLSKDNLEIQTAEAEDSLLIRRWAPGGEEAVLLLNFCPAACERMWEIPKGVWRKLLDSAETRWLGPGVCLPVEFASTGKAALPITRYSCGLYVRMAGRPVEP
jgi:maltooligosyltrehalose trehalohydrolase